MYMDIIWGLQSLEYVYDEWLKSLKRNMICIWIWRVGACSPGWYIFYMGSIIYHLLFMNTFVYIICIYNDIFIVLRALLWWLGITWWQLWVDTNYYNHPWGLVRVPLRHIVIGHVICARVLERYDSRISYSSIRLNGTQAIKILT